MKKIAILFGFSALLAAVDAQAAPDSMSFAGRLSTSSGPVNGAISVTFAVHSAATGGVAAWTDTLPLFANQGLVFATLGSATNPLDDTVFTGATMFLEITVQGETLTPRLPIGSVPYALRSDSASFADTAATADTADTLGTLTPSQVVTSVTAGTGLTGGGSGGSVSLSVDSAKVQSRVTGSCSAGQSIQTIAADGAVTCEADDNTTYTQGPGIAITGTTVALTTCPAGQILKSTGTSWSCQNDNNNIYTASTGITINGTNQISIDSTLVARKDAAAGNQAFDTNTLFLDYTNNRVGVGTVTPITPLEVAGAVRATDFQYSAPVTGQVMASPSWCVRDFSAPDAESLFVSPPASLFGPLITQANPGANIVTSWLCPIHLEIPPGSGLVTITAMTMAYDDGATTCRVRGELLLRPLGTLGSVTPITAIDSGINATDFTAAPGTTTKTVTGLAANVRPDTIAWVKATIAQNATGNGRCGYAGALINYTVTHP